MTPELTEATQALSATFNRMRLIEGRMFRSIATMKEGKHEDEVAKPTIESRAAGLSSVPAALTYLDAIDMLKSIGRKKVK